MNLISDIKSLLTGIESNIYLGDKPDTPNNLICINPSGGYNPTVNVSLDVIDRPTFQIIVRDTSYSSAITRVEAIKAILNGIANRVINSTTYITILQLGDVLPLGRDSKDRIELSINFSTQIKK